MKPHSGSTTLRAALLLVVTIALVFGGIRSIRAQLTKPTEQQQKVAKHIAAYLRQVHIRKRPIDDEFSREFLRSFLDTLDPLRLFFLRSDVEEFAASENTLDDSLNEGEYDVAWRMFKRFVQRLDERFSQIDRLVELEHDFTVDERILKDRSENEYARTSDELTEAWRKHVKLLILEGVAGGEDEKDVKDRIRKRYRNLKRRMHQTDAYELIEMFVTSGTMLFDPHTTYMSPDTLESFEIAMRLELEGIGAALQSVDGYTVVMQIIAGGAADKDGRLKPQDKIVAVGQGQEGELVDIVDMKLREVVKLIRGKKGTTVRLEVLHDVAKTKETLVLERAKVQLSDREAHGEVFPIPPPDGDASAEPLKVGVIDLPSFYMDMAAARTGRNDYKSTTRDVRKILENFEKDGVDAVVVDLRQNGGGALPEAIDMTGLFIDTGPIVQIKDPRGNVETESDKDRGMAWAGPLVVLTSKFSASASEIFAGAIQDYGRGLVVGDASTHGKGTVQRLVDLGRGSFLSKPEKMGALKITVSQFYRPTGASTQSRGVVPDIVLPSVRNHMEIGESVLDHAIEFDTIRPAGFQRLELIDASIVEKLSQASKKRRAESEDFADIETAITRYLEVKKNKWIPLQKEKYLAQHRIDLKDDTTGTEEPAATDDEGKASDEETPIRRDFYLDEVFAITSDYVRFAS